MTATTTEPAAIIDVLSVDDQSDLDLLEETIAHGLETFWEVGAALLTIRDRKLYRAEYPTFAAYCEARWDMSRQRAYQLIDASKTAELLSTMVDISGMNERQVRELSRADPADLPAVIERADQIAGATPRTSAHIKQAVAESDLPINFAIVQRRLAAHGITLERDGGMFVTYQAEKDVGIATPTWANVTDRLDHLDSLIVGQRDEPHKPDPKEPPPARFDAETDDQGGRDRKSYEAKERADADLLAMAETELASGNGAYARQLLDRVQVSTYRRDQLMRGIPRVLARTFLDDQRARLAHFSPGAMISQVTYRQALDHIAALLEVAE